MKMEDFVKFMKSLFVVTFMVFAVATSAIILLGAILYLIMFIIRAL